MVWVGNTGSTLKFKYFIATLASTQGVSLSIIPIIIMMTTQLLYGSLVTFQTH